MRLNIPDVHREQTYAARADNRERLDVMRMDVGWHVALLRSGSIDR
jgi:hypothetical protein